MPQELATKKHVHAGHRASATRMVAKTEHLLAEESPDATKLSQLMRSLQEKLEVLKMIDVEVTVDEADFGDDIEQSDSFKECCPG